MNLYNQSNKIYMHTKLGMFKFLSDKMFIQV